MPGLFCAIETRRGEARHAHEIAIATQSAKKTAYNQFIIPLRPASQSSNFTFSIVALVQF